MWRGPRVRHPSLPAGLGPADTANRRGLGLQEEVGKGGVHGKEEGDVEWEADWCDGDGLTGRKR